MLQSRVQWIGTVISPQILPHILLRAEQEKVIGLMVVGTAAYQGPVSLSYVRQPLLLD